MARVLEPLLPFGIRYEGQGAKALMPLTLHGAKDAQAITAHVATASAQVKSALLLAALNARGTTHIHQEALTRDHSEKMLRAFGARIHVTPCHDGGEAITLDGPARLTGCTLDVPRDPSSRRLCHRGGPDRAGLGNSLACHPAQSPPHRADLETLLEMGARIEVRNRRSSGGEEVGDLVVHHSALRGVTVPASRAPSMIDEYPVLAVAAAFAHGRTEMHGLEELRVKESDRLAAVAAGLLANGVRHTIEGDNLIVEGMAMLLAVALSRPIWITASP